MCSLQNLIRFIRSLRPRQRLVALKLRAPNALRGAPRSLFDVCASQLLDVALDAAADERQRCARSVATRAASWLTVHQHEAIGAGMQSMRALLDVHVGGAAGERFVDDLARGADAACDLFALRAVVESFGVPLLLIVAGGDDASLVKNKKKTN